MTVQTAEGSPGIPKRTEVMDPPVIPPQYALTRMVKAVIGDRVKVKGMRRTTPMDVLIPGRAPAMIPQSPPRIMARRFCGRKMVAKAPM
jgi:hypothetical protein